MINNILLLNVLNFLDSILTHLNVMVYGNAIESSSYPYYCMISLGEFWYVPKILGVLWLSYCFLYIKDNVFLNNALKFCNIGLGYAVLMNTMFLII